MWHINKYVIIHYQSKSNENLLPKKLTFVVIYLSFGIKKTLLHLDDDRKTGILYMTPSLKLTQTYRVIWTHRDKHFNKETFSSNRGSKSGMVLFMFGTCEKKHFLEDFAAQMYVK